MSLRSRCEKRAKLAKAKLAAFEPPNPWLKPLHTNAVFRPRVMSRRKGYNRNKQAVKAQVAELTVI